MRGGGQGATPSAERVGLPEEFSAACAALEERLGSVPLALLPEAAGAVMGAVERARTRVLIGVVAPPRPAEVESHEEVLTSKEAADLLRRTPDWFGRHRGDYASALVSRPGQRARYSRWLLERCLAKQNRAHTRN
jgi:hypothetical protein